jgi:glutathione S-transferase
MTSTRRRIHAAFLLALPIIVAWFDFSVVAAAAAVLLMLLWRLMIVQSSFVAPEKTPPLILETIGVSHFVEKVRWCMDRLQLDYVERQSAGILGVLMHGRTVPCLKVKTGLVQSVIGNSSDILRYLWATNYRTDGVDASFLEPTPERIMLERRLDRYGRDLQVWIYYHILSERKLTLQGWGVHSPLVPRWQRSVAIVCYPLLAFFIRKSFSITEAHYAKVVHNIEELLSETDTQLADGRRSILGHEANNYTDIEFAAMSGLWLQPKQYGAGQADSSRFSRDDLPTKMRADIERWIEDHPKSISFIERLYEEER